MPITTASEYKTHRGITGSDYDTLIGNLITQEQAWLERRLGRAFDEATYTDEAYDGTGTGELWLDNRPVSALTAVKILASDGTTTTLDSGDYRLVDSQYIHRLKSTGWDAVSPWDGYSGPCFPRGHGNILVTYTAGYAADEHPEDLVKLMFQLVDIALDERGQNPVIQQRADGVVQRTRMSPADAERARSDLVRPWKRVSV
ncbi:MAG: hypothetical protein JJ916_04205 [Phycisphaerales bacterium]|nr:hypothetical protein [Phycisphaerales bacterium]